MRLIMCAVAGLAAAGPVVGQSAAPASAERDREAIGQVMLYKAAQAGAPSSGGGVGGGVGGGAGGGVGGFTVLQPSAQSSPAGAGAEYTVHWAQPGPDATITDIRRFVQEQQHVPLQINGKPVTLRATGASLQVYLGDEPYPESRMKTEGNRTVLLDADGKPAGEMVVTGQRVELRAIQDEQQGRLLIGVSLSPVDATLANHLKIEPEKASVISTITEGWPASKAGLQSGDIIVSVEGKDEGTSEAIRAVIAEHEAGDAIKLRVISGGEQKDVTITLSDEARASTVTGVGSVNVSPQYWSALELAPHVTGQQVIDLNQFPQASQYREQLQRAEELRAVELRRRQAGQAGGRGQRSAEVAEAQVRVLREQMAAARQDGERAEMAEAQAGALRELVAAQRELREFAVATDATRVTVDIPSGGSSRRAVIATRPEGDISRRLGAIEERMARIEKLLEKLTEQGGSR